MLPPGPVISPAPAAQSCELTLAKVVGCAPGTLHGLVPKGGSGTPGGLRILHEELSGCKGRLVARVAAVGKLANRAGWFGTNRAFYTLSKAREDGQYVPLYKSEVVAAKDPVWKALMLSMAAVCGGDLHRPLQITVFHEPTKASQAPIPIGSCSTSVFALAGPDGHSTNWQTQLKHPKGKSKSCGTLAVPDARVESEPTFVEYLEGGLAIELAVAIDLTASNGDPGTLSSLHSTLLGPQGGNSYEKAINAVGSVLGPYDSDNSIAAYGFGAQLPPAYNVSHCFALSGNAASPGCPGVEGVMSAYHKALRVVRLSGPTCFAPVIEVICTQATRNMASTPAGHLATYSVLLIITDGVIQDEDATARAIVRASRLPLSIIIVGVGSADFAGMNFLDSDSTMLKAGGEAAVRDVVQFVAMRDYEGPGSEARLAAEVLAEIPSQVTSYFRQIAKVNPSKPPPVAPWPAAGAAAPVAAATVPSYLQN
jgi:copine 1/2/3